MHYLHCTLSLNLFMKHKIYLFTFLFISSLNLIAQTEIKYQNGDSVIGKPCPSYIFENIQNYSKNQVSLSELKGKWLILDFWNNGCLGCVQSFPRINELAKQFAEKVQFILIGNIGNGFTLNATQALYEKCKK